MSGPLLLLLVTLMAPTLHAGIYGIQRDGTQAGHLSAASRATALAELIDSRQADG